MKDPIILVVHKRTLPDWWYDTWQANGWHDGRNFGTPDSMYVQYTTGA